MGLLKIIKIRIENKKKQERAYQLSRKMCCESCAYCFEVDQCMGYVDYACFLRESSFRNDEREIFINKCEKYKPCRKYRKYLKDKK